MSIDPAILAARADVRRAAEGAVISELNCSLHSLEPGASIDLHPAAQGHPNQLADFFEGSALAQQGY